VSECTAFAQINTLNAPPLDGLITLNVDNGTEAAQRAIKRLLCTRRATILFRALRIGRKIRATAGGRRAIGDLDERHLPVKCYGQMKTRCVGACAAPALGFVLTRLPILRMT
jgi:hypothetical protein